jgi:hypothetical protein
MIGTPLPHVPSIPTSAVNEIRAALKPPFVRKGYFFGSGHNVNAHGIADAEAEPAEKMLAPIAAPLRTQEIMLFYLATLLRTLAIDTYKVIAQLLLESCRTVSEYMVNMIFFGVKAAARAFLTIIRAAVDRSAR